MRVWLLLAFAFASTTLLAGDTCSGNFDRNKRKHGVWVCREGSKVVKKERYRHGELLTYIIFDEKGKVIESRNRKGKIKKFNPCGC